MNNSNDSAIEMIAQVLDEMKSVMGTDFSLEKVNLAELERRTGISRQRLRSLKKNNFQPLPEPAVPAATRVSSVEPYHEVINRLLTSGVTNSVVCHEHLKKAGYTGSCSSVKRYIQKHRNLIPAKRQLVAPQGNRGRRYTTEPGEAFQMDWGFTKVIDHNGNEYQAACFAMICHHCGMRYVEFFPNARQENLFIGMLHAFLYMGIPECVLTDNMKSVVIRRDLDGNPIWHPEYEAFMKTIGFRTKLCRPRHPFTKGKVERLIRFVKDNFLAGRTFWNVTDLNLLALRWCNEQNNVRHRATDSVPSEVHASRCIGRLQALDQTESVLNYLYPLRKITFDGFVNYEGRRFGIPYSYHKQVVRISREGYELKIFSSDMSELLVTHDVTWSKKDRYCAGQFPDCMPEELPTAPVKVRIGMLPPSDLDDAFSKFDFDREAF